MNKNAKKTIKLLALATTSSLLTTPTLAADAAKSLYEEVIVSAEKREILLRDLPGSANVLTPQLINNAHLNSLSDIASVIPNLQIAQPNGDVLPIFSIRGVSMADYSTNQSSPIGVYLDGVYMSANYLHGMALFDLDRVEVLKGPQGTLYGKNTTGGAIHLIGKTPDFEADGDLKLSLGNYDAYEIEAAYETPLLADKLALRLAANIAKADGYSKNHAPGQDDLSEVDRQAFKATLRWQPSDELEAILRVNSSNSDPNAPAVIPEASIPTDFGNIDVMSLLLAGAAQPFYVRPDSYDGWDADVNKVGKMEIENDGLSLHINWQLDKVTLSSVTGYYDGSYDLRADSDGTPQQVLELDYLSDNDQFSQEFSISSNSDQPFGYIAGLYFTKDSVETQVNYDYFHSYEVVAPGFNPPFTGFTQVQKYEQERKSKAIYGQISYALSEQLNFTGGLRYTRDNGKQFNVHTYTADYDGNPMVGLIPFSFPYDPTAVYPAQRTEDDEWTGTLQLDYQINEHHMAYASFSRGYRSSAFNGAAVNDPSELEPVDPEYINAWEIGAKGQLLEGKLNYSTALFHYDYRGLQFINVVGVTQVLESADRAEVTGLDLELQAQLTEQLNINLGLGWLDTEFEEGLDLFAQGQSWDLSGNDLPNAPEFNAHLSANYRMDIEAGEINSFLNYQFIDDQWFTAFNDTAGYAPIGQSNYALVDARISFSPKQSNMTFALWGKNLSNKDYKLFGINLSESFGYNYTIHGAPRTYGVEFITKF